MALALAESECLVFIAVLAGTLSWSFPFLAGREKKKKAKMDLNERTKRSERKGGKKGEKEREVK